MQLGCRRAAGERGKHSLSAVQPRSQDTKRGAGAAVFSRSSIATASQNKAYRCHVTAARRAPALPQQRAERHCVQAFPASFAPSKIPDSVEVVPNCQYMHLNHAEHSGLEALQWGMDLTSVHTRPRCASGTYISSQCIYVDDALRAASMMYRKSAPLCTNTIQSPCRARSLTATKIPCGAHASFIKPGASLRSAYAPPVQVLLLCSVHSAQSADHPPLRRSTRASPRLLTRPRHLHPRRPRSPPRPRPRHPPHPRTTSAAAAGSARNRNHN